MHATGTISFAEIRRLIDTVLLSTITSTDPDYLDQVRVQLRVAIKYELNLRGLALTWHNLCARNQQAGQQIRDKAATAAEA